MAWTSTWTERVQRPGFSRVRWRSCYPEDNAAHVYSDRALFSHHSRNVHVHMRAKINQTRTFSLGDATPNTRMWSALASRVATTGAGFYYLFCTTYLPPRPYVRIYLDTLPPSSPPSVSLYLSLSISLPTPLSFLHLAPVHVQACALRSWLLHDPPTWVDINYPSSWYQALSAPRLRPMYPST